MSATMNLAPKRISKRQAAIRLRIPVPAVNRLIDSGELKAVPLANTRAVVLESSVDQLVARMAGDDRQAG
jgi:hypothetical protein